jgi:nitrogen fixation-related uncharacterized protein
MVPSSIVAILTGLVLGAIALATFAWAWRRGAFEQLEEQANVIFEPRDWRLLRPWESPAQQEERRLAYGEPIRPEPGEWGEAR